MTRFLASELLRVRSRRIVWVLTLVAAAGAVVGIVIGAVNSRPTSPDAMALGDVLALVEGIATMVILLGIVLGASLVGADWASGTYATLLTWEPRRLRALVARLAVVAAAVFSITGALQALFVATFRAAIALRGTTAGAPADWLGQVTWTGFRVAITAAAFSLVAAALATIGRSTVLAVGSLFGYLVIVEGFLVGFVQGIDRWLLVRAMSVVVTDEPMFGFDEGDGLVEVMSVARGRLLVLGYVVVLAVIAAAVLRRRDVQ